MPRMMKALSTCSLVALCLSFGACAADSDCCKDGADAQGTQVNASVMSDKPKSGCCASGAKEQQVNASVMSDKPKAGCCKTNATECKDASTPKP